MPFFGEAAFGAFVVFGPVGGLLLLGWRHARVRICLQGRRRAGGGNCRFRYRWAAGDTATAAVLYSVWMIGNSFWRRVQFLYGCWGSGCVVFGRHGDLFLVGLICGTTAGCGTGNGEHGIGVGVV